MSAPSTQLDSRVRIVTPENIAFEYRAAGPFSRIGAYLLDLLILAGLFFATFLLFLFIGGVFGLPGVGWLVMLAIGFVVYWFYGGFFEWAWNGQTPGKRVVGLRVLRTDGRPVAAWQAILRNLLRYLDLFPYVTLTEVLGEDSNFFWPTCLIGLVAMACSPRYQRVGDLACNTMVVAEEPSGSGRAEKDWLAASGAARDPALQSVLDTLPASYRPSRTLARALSHYVGRRRYLGPARRREIARHVGGPLAERFGLPAQTDHDLLLCALYARVFLAESENGLDAQPEPQPSGSEQATPAESLPNGRGSEETPRFQPAPETVPAPEIAANGSSVPGSPEYQSLLPKPPTPSS